MAVITSYWGLDGIIAFTSLVVILYLYMTRKFKYWVKQGVTEVPPTPFMGNFTKCFMMKQTIADLARELYTRSKGLPYIGFYIFDKPFFLARDPEIVKLILVKDFNSFSDRYASPDVTDRLGYANLFMMKNPAWKVLRTKLTPIFTSGKLKRMFELLVEVCNDLDNHLESLKLQGSGKVVEMKDLAANFTTDMIASTAFGMRINSVNNPDTVFRKYCRKIFDYQFVRAFELLTIFMMPQLVKYTRVTFLGKDTTRYMRTAFWDVITYRMETQEKRNDLIDLLIELKKAHENDGDLDGFKFDGDDLVAQAVIFLLGGFESASTIISFTLYELALNPTVQEKLRAEINEALEKNDGKMTYEMVVTLPYLDMTISESLRKYPPLGFLDRVATTDYKIPNSDVVLKKGTPVYIPVSGLHYDPKYYPDPEKYDPERFSEENKRSRPSCTYIPFGEGPHNCIGFRLGLIQSKMGIIQFLKKYEVTPCKETSIPLVMNPKGLTTTALGGIYLNIRKLQSESN